MIIISINGWIETFDLLEIPWKKVDFFISG